MAIRKDIDDMLNNLKSGKPLESPEKPDVKPIPKKNDSKLDNMSVDDLLSSLNTKKKTAIVSEIPEAPKAKPKKKIVISHELPDYEAIRAEEQRREQERIKAEKLAAEKAEKARIEAEKRAAEEAERARIEAEKKAAEEAEKARMEAEKEAAEKAEKARIEAEKKAAEKAERARIKAEKKAAEKAEKARIKAEKKAAEEAEKARIEAEKALSEEIADEEDTLSDEKTQSFADEAVAAYSNADIEPADNPEVSDDTDEAFEEVTKKNKSFFKKKKSNKLEEYETDNTSDDAYEQFAPEEKKTSKLTSALQNILDEDPDEIINHRREQAESDDEPPRKGRLKKSFYAIFGVIFALLACVGLVTVIAKGIDMFSSYTSGNSRKDSFEKALYPAVIMDIESFESPAELPSEQVITAAIWSMIMTEGVTEQYELTFDVVIIPAADVESYAVKLFGDNLPVLNHTTVGPAESRFYYNEETKSYNVPVAPVTYTYTPEVRKATKIGNEYTVKVDYIDELPSWLPKTSSKSVEYTLVEENGGYRLKSMRILSTNTNAV